MAMLVAQPSWARQYTHKAEYWGYDIQFEYEWEDQHGERQQLSFDLPIDDVERGMQEFQPFDNNDANATAFKAVKEYAKQHSTRGNHITIKPVRSGYSVEYAGYDADAGAEHIQMIAKLRDKTFENYMFNHFYTRIDEETIMPDHKRIAQRYVRAMSPVAEAIRAQTKDFTPRQVVNYTLSFFQTIPYDELRSRYTSNGAGFQTPYGLLKYNRGDCDTKSVAMAAVLRNLFPHVRIVMVYVPHHAFIGVHFKPGENDYALQLGGQPFVLADPTGPALVRIGQVEGRAVGYLSRKEYSYQEIPF